MKCVLFLLLLPLFLFGDHRVELVHDFTANPSSQELLAEESPWHPLKRALEEKNLHLISSNLEGFKDSADVACLVFWNVPEYAKKALPTLPKKKMILFLWEPPTVLGTQYKEKMLAHFSKIYTWDDAFVDNKKFFKFHYPVLHPMHEDLPCYADKKLCTLIITHKQSKHPLELYSEREKVIRFFEGLEKPDFEFYGRGWDPQKYKNYRGIIENKIEKLKRYRFSFCYENMRGTKGYITEKIFDCFEAGCIPIYLGADNIEEYVPANCFIDRRRFSSEQAVYDHIKNMPQKEYETYLTHIRAFLKSEKAQVFSSKHFLRTFVEAVSRN
jgi:hypothetical protein